MACPYCDSQRYKIHSRRQFKCKLCNRTFSRKLYGDQKVKIATTAETRIHGKSFIVTCAISDSKVNKRFLQAIEHHNSVTGSQLIVVPTRYRNPTTNTEKQSDTYDAAIAKYMRREKVRIHDSLIVLGDVPIQPTNSRPLSGVESFTGTSSAIVGHPRIALETVATQVGTMAKILAATGAITEPAYSQSFAGSKGVFHHSIGAVIVDIREDGKFELRHIHAEKDGSFYDLDQHWFGDRVERENIDVLAVGDLHGRNACPVVLRKTFFEHDSLVRRLAPNHIVLHDVLDCDSKNHHQNYFDKFRQYAKNKSDVMTEIKETVTVLDAIGACCDAKVHVIASNHDDHIDKWLQKHEHADDLENAIVFHETRLAILQGIKSGNEVSGFGFWFRKLRKAENVTMLDRNDSLVINGVEYGFHGDKCANGAKGSARSYAKIGVKSVIGHSHSPKIVDGCYQVGHCLDETNVSYISGSPSGWMNCHCLQYKSGKRTLVFIIR